MNRELARRREAERWIARIRLGAVAFALLQIGVRGGDYPRGYGTAVWVTTGVLTVGALALWWVSSRELDLRGTARLGLAALAFDTAICSAYLLVYAFQPGTPIRQLLFVPLVEAALRYGLLGGVVLPIVVAPVYAAFEWLRGRHLGLSFRFDDVTFQVGVQIITGLIVGWLVRRLDAQTEVAESRAAEAERLRDRLGRRVDVLEASNRCSRALGSSLRTEQAFSAFIRELRGLVPFDRMAIVLAEDGSARVMATAGRGADTVFPPGTTRPIQSSVLEEVLQGRAVYREDMDDRLHPEEDVLLELGLRCRLVVPLLLGARAIGMLGLVRAEPRSFTAEEIELTTLLGRLVATAVQNIRAYEAERSRGEELRRLSALRADFVSLVSHELRSPMAAVIGAAGTLHERWRELSSDQREAFLALIEDETTRLSGLVGDVLDTSRIEAGTLSYTFSDVNLAELVEESVAAAAVGQGGVTVTGAIADSLPTIRGDRERLRQLLANLIENAVEHSSSGGDVRVSAFVRDGAVHVDVADDGPGIAGEHHGLIFERFGRVQEGAATPGTGLGLFIARSIAEAHGGSVDVSSAPERGATFTVRLPTQDGRPAARATD